MHQRCAGLVVNQQTVVACVRLAEAGGVHLEVRTFGTTTPELLALAEWLAAHKCTHVATEALGASWKPIWHALEGRCELVLASARERRQVPGRKAEVNDATAIADLLARGEIGPGPVPAPYTRPLRDVIRTREQLIRERSLPAIEPALPTLPSAASLPGLDLSVDEDPLLSFSPEPELGAGAGGRVAKVAARVQTLRPDIAVAFAARVGVLATVSSGQALRAKAAAGAARVVAGVRVLRRAVAGVRMPRPAVAVIFAALASMPATVVLLRLSGPLSPRVAAARMSGTRLLAAPYRRIEQVAAAALSSTVASASRPHAGDRAGAEGQLEIVSDPTGVPVTMDGVTRGTTPLKLAHVADGKHTVTLSKGGVMVRRIVSVPHGSAATVAVSMGRSPAGSMGSSPEGTGWVATSAAIELQIFEDGRPLGVTGSNRLKLPVGRHDLDFVNEPLEFRTRRTVQISSHNVTWLGIAVPDGSLSVNALPWAEVFVDGRSVGVTPLANVPVPIGSHEILWRHPQLGEARRNVAVTAVAPTRVGTVFGQ